jgi:hypothetical protein
VLRRSPFLYRQCPLGALGCLADALQSFPQTGDYGDRSNQSSYQHPILNVDAQDAETFNKRMQGFSSDRTAIVDPEERPQRPEGDPGTVLMWVRKPPIPIKFCFRGPASVSSLMKVAAN